MAYDDYATFTKKVENARRFAAGYRNFVEANLKEARELDERGKFSERDAVMRNALNFTEYEDSSFVSE